MPLGCGSRAAEIPRHVDSTRAGPTVPGETVAALTACVEEGAARLTDTSYAILVDVDVDEDGHVEGARVKDSIIGDPGIESCMVSALRGMSLPASITRTGRVSPESRRYVGNAGAGALVALGPIALAAAGITVLMVVTVYIVEETVEAISKRERKKIDDKCQELLHECLDHPKHPDGKSSDFGENKPCGDCKRQCVHQKGEWPNDKCPRPN
jgi:hypothetical protein